MQLAGLRQLARARMRIEGHWIDDDGLGESELFW